MAGPKDSSDILKDVMTRDNAAYKQRADMGEALHTAFVMEGNGARRISNADPSDNNRIVSTTHRDPEPALSPND